MIFVYSADDSQNYCLYIIIKKSSWKKEIDIILEKYKISSNPLKKKRKQTVRENQ